MGRLFSISILYALSFTLILTGPAALRGGETPADNNGTAAAPVVLPAPVKPPADKPNPLFLTGAHHQQDRDEDLRTFRDNAWDNPELAARALIAVLNRLGPDTERSQIFKSRNYRLIAAMLDRLEKMATANRLPPEDYKKITAELAPFNINTILGRAMRGGGTDREPGPGRSPGSGKDFGSGRTEPDDRPDRKDEPKNPIDDLVDARRALESGDAEQTEKSLKLLQNDYPDSSGVQAAVAAYYNEMENYAMAAKTATSALKLDPENPEAYKTRALARAALADRKGAVEDVKKAMEMDPQDESARLLSALIESKKEASGLRALSSLEEMKKAFGAVGAAGAVKKDEGVFNDPRAGLAGLTRSGEGGADGRGTGVWSPDYSKSNIYLKTAMAKNRLGDYESAARYAGLALEKNPDNLDARLERANANNFLGLYDEAIKDASFVIERNPSNTQALNMRAWALNRKGRPKDAEADANKVIGLNPGFADAWFNRALAYEKQGNYRAMLSDFGQAAALNSAYGARFQDAVAQYANRVPNFSYPKAGVSPAGGRPPEERSSGVKRFAVLLIFTLTGGLLIALGFMHIVTSSKGAAATKAKTTHPDVLSPSVFYEGVATGKYAIEKKMGAGGMGVVYEATDQSLGRKVAIKKMHDEIKLNEREKQRFLEEARTVALLHHPNIVEIYTIFEEEDNIYLVFEHIDGLTLDKMLDKEVRLAWDRARPIFDGAAKALSYAHSKNVVHRDLKLSNIMISSDAEVKVMDFGLARHAQESLARASNSEVVGSPAYMAPEQELGVSSRESDIYSLGVCLYEALTGDMPFKGPDFHYQKVHRLYQPLSATLSGLPAGLDVLIAKALDPEPGNRFKTAEEFRKALLDIAGACPT
ncbi:MAG: protein kinase [Elusimicrobia bacterium]|nr:protein kinase [Elusimicrobiota bacterium]